MTATASPITPLITKLNIEWDTDLAGRMSVYGALGAQRGDVLLERIRTATGAEQDELLHALLCLAREGHRGAERILVQALVPAARRMAHRVRALDELDRTDRVGFALGAAWESIRTYKLHLSRRVMANLTMGMLSILAPAATANDRVIASHTHPVSDEILEHVAGAWEDPGESPDAQLANLFTWAVDTNVITSSEVALLSRASLGDESHMTIAADLKITVDGLRTRLKRIRKRLSIAAEASYI
ncbi:hypothetical protein ACR8AL_07375 [Clavibacter sepedonicus]|uniref:Uncharacterized protein n=1 Tax=Clavibacter sepedonicus TaxID=31964 RepID=B0RJD6_CLASE|nr:MULTISPECIES: hypothetical protein [Clavibacter]MBD5382485.1 hypothetical protein [Clavibacter sp.]OQJ45270.1 hypothetical protein B5P19_15520 [Clavibacter sepedonicus]OQJ50956.1 hypothetical protein B5P20_16155 [Clavibacter sepedonicus]UUK67237.1 hypothetical protein LRE50_15880 [Clavibacter sepedonicus]CAQ03326.1 hypothetical protein pCSL0083 [Clavibacter sepedonicus]